MIQMIQILKESIVISKYIYETNIFSLINHIQLRNNYYSIFNKLIYSLYKRDKKWLLLF